MFQPIFSLTNLKGLITYMKLLFKSMVCGLVISCILSMTGFCSVCENLRKDVFRLHILANSDSVQDQTLKLKVRDGILDYTAEIFRNCTSREQALETAEKHLDRIKAECRKVIRENGFDYSVEVYTTKMNFNTRVYENFTLPAGKYDALRIVIGSGNGHNWWCMIYPSLCIPSAQQNKPESSLDESEMDVISHSGQYEVKFRLVEIFENICAFFSE